MLLGIIGTVGLLIAVLVVFIAIIVAMGVWMNRQ